MSLKRNIAANYTSQIYVTTVGIIMIPLYIEHMGAEAYGLVGFFAMLQAWFNLLDMGLTPTMARETARYNGGAMDAASYRRLARALEGVFAVVALIGGSLLFFTADWITNHWLNATQLPATEITQALQLIAIIIALRWMCGLYRGVISGSERLIWLSAFNTGISTLRFVLVLPILAFVSATPLAFFSFQLLTAAVELAGLSWFAYRLLPSLEVGKKIFWEWAPLKPLLKFSISIAFTSLVWVMVTQTDKLVLSKILPLANYGYFTVAVLVASSISIMTGPISSAIMPRMARLQAEGQNDQMIAVYRQATQLAMAVAIPIALVLTFFSEQVLWAWTGDVKLVKLSAPVLTLYAAGYGLLAASAFPYYLQYAKGDLKLHIIGNVLFVLLLIPSVIWAAIYHGMEGAGWAWVMANIVYFLTWVPLVHRNFLPSLHWAWLQADVIRPISLSIPCSLAISLFTRWSDNRAILSIELVSTGLIIFLLTLSQAGKAREMLLKKSKKLNKY